MRRLILMMMLLVGAAFLAACEPGTGNTTANRPANSANSANNATTAPAADAAAIETEIKKLANDGVASILKGDTAAVEKLWNDNYVFIAQDGTVTTKAQRIDAMKSGQSKLESLAYDDATKRWNVCLRTKDGHSETLVVNAVISAVGQLNRPRFPEIPGMDTFAGPSFHSARWDHECELEATRVAVIGTGASAIQFVPEIQPLVKKLHVFQRTAPWIVKRHDRPFAKIERDFFRRFPPSRFDDSLIESAWCLYLL